MKELWYMFSGYRLKVAYQNGVAQVSMYDLGDLRFPLQWSKTMTKEQARGAIELFKNVGYYDMPV